MLSKNTGFNTTPFGTRVGLGSPHVEKKNKRVQLFQNSQNGISLRIPLCVLREGLTRTSPIVGMGSREGSGFLWYTVTPYDPKGCVFVNTFHKKCVP